LPKASVDDDDDEQKGEKRIARADLANSDLEELKRVASDKDTIHRKIQLWTNNEENEYAIRLLLDGDPESEAREKKGRREFLASTNPTGRYTHPVAEADRLELLQDGWDYTLQDLLDNYKKVRMGLVRSSAFTSYAGDSSENHDIGVNNDSNNDYPIKIISTYKCTYCLAEFKNEEKKKKHELKWHI
jgi:hypothetical protein